MFDFTIRLGPNPAAPGAARRALEGLRPSLGAAVDEVALLISEVVTNAVRHAGLTERDTIRVHVCEHPGIVRVEVSHPSVDFDPARDRRAGDDVGLGLRLLDRLAARWGVERGLDTTVWFEVVAPPTVSV